MKVEEEQKLSTVSLDCSSFLYQIIEQNVDFPKLL